MPSNLGVRQNMRELHTIKIGISPINIMIDSFPMREKLIALGEFGQDIVN